jgi:hypothetical protein
MGASLARLRGWLGEQLARAWRPIEKPINRFAEKHPIRLGFWFLLVLLNVHPYVNLRRYPLDLYAALTSQSFDQLWSSAREWYYYPYSILPAAAFYAVAWEAVLLVARVGWKLRWVIVGLAALWFLYAHTRTALLCFGVGALVLAADWLYGAIRLHLLQQRQILQNQEALLRDLGGRRRESDD